jgi:DNA anti-recombination protein RmuC
MAINEYAAVQIISPFWGWTSYTPVIPKLYWDVYSSEDRLKNLCREFDKLTHYASMLAEEVNTLSNNVEQTLADFEQKIQAQIEAQNEAVAKQLAEQDAKVAAELRKMRAYIDEKFKEFAQGTQTYDVTTGTYRPSYQAMRRLFQALSYDHKGAEQLVSYLADNKTVGEMADQTVYNVAYSNRPTIVIDDQNQAASILGGN